MSAKLKKIAMNKLSGKKLHFVWYIENKINVIILSRKNVFYSSKLLKYSSLLVPVNFATDAKLRQGVN